MSVKDICGVWSSAIYKHLIPYKEARLPVKTYRISLRVHDVIGGKICRYDTFTGISPHIVVSRV